MAAGSGTARESAPTGPAAVGIPVGPSIAAEMATEGVIQTPVAAAGQPEPPPVEPAEPAAPALPSPAPGVTAVDAAFVGARPASPKSPPAQGSPAAGAPAPATGAAQGTEVSLGLQPTAEVPPTSESPGRFDTRAGTGASVETPEPALPSLHADDGPGSTRSSATTGHAAPARADGLGDRGPEAVERPATHTGDFERAERVLQQLRLRISPGLRRANLALEPAHLGRIAIALHVRDGRLRAVLRAEKPETLGVLEAHVPELRAMLEQSGIEAKDIDLGLGAESDAGAEADAKGGKGSNAGGPAGDPFGLEDTDTDMTGKRRLLSAVTDQLGVDTYA